MVKEKSLPFKELVIKYEPLIKNQIKRLQQAKLYDELYQIGLIALWEAKTQFDHSKGHFPSYAKKYVRGKLLNYLNAERKFYERNQMCKESELINNFPANVYRKQVCFPAARIVELLSKTEQIWFHEFYQHGKGPKAIASQYNVSIETVKTWRKRALEKIRTNIKTSELLELFNLSNE